MDDGFDSSLEDEEYGDEDKYDALNDETFGSDAIAEDWEQDHEKLAQITESSRVQNKNECPDYYNEKSDKVSGIQLIKIFNSLNWDFLI